MVTVAVVAMVVSFYDIIDILKEVVEPRTPSLSPPLSRRLPAPTVAPRSFLFVRSPGRRRQSKAIYHLPFLTRPLVRVLRLARTHLLRNCTVCT